MRTRAQTIRLGVFVTTAMGLFLVLLVLLSGARLLEQRDHYSILFAETVSGLEAGAPVKLLGVRVGRIESFRVRSYGEDRVEVQVSLDHGTPIRSNAVARLSGSGLTGLQFVEITGGTAEAQLIQPGERIPAGPSLMGTLTGKAESIAIKAEDVLNRVLHMAEQDNLDNLRRTLDNVRAVTAQARTLLEGLEGEENRVGPLLTGFDDAAVSVRDAGVAIEGLASNGKETTENLAALTAQDGALHSALIEAEQTFEVVSTVLGGEDATRTAQDVRNALQSFTRTMNQMSSVISGSSTDIREISASLRDTAEHLEEFALSIREDPSLIVRRMRES